MKARKTQEELLGLNRDRAGRGRGRGGDKAVNKARALASQNLTLSVTPNKIDPQPPRRVQPLAKTTLLLLGIDQHHSQSRDNQPSSVLSSEANRNHAREGRKKLRQVEGG